MHFNLKSSFEKVSGVQHGLVEQFRRPEVTVLPSPGVRMGDMQVVRPRGYEEVQGLMVAILGEQRPVIAVVHPDQLETTVALFEHLGYDVEVSEYTARELIEMGQADGV